MKGTVLIVDDEQLPREAMAAVLEHAGHTVLSAGDGEAGLALALQRHPDVILLDVMMPGLNGYEVCRRLKQHKVARSTPVLFISGESTREARLAGLEAGASDFLIKPFDSLELEIRVRNHLRAQRLSRDLESAEDMIFAIARLVEARDTFTGGHCTRLSEMLLRLGTRLGLSDEEVQILRRGGHLHDVGKVAIPDGVLLKPGGLSADEWRLMKKHVEIGAEICSSLRTLAPVMPVIRCHHERLDGSGYPAGLRGEEIPWLARIFQIADIFDALTNKRSYREPLSTAAALEVLAGEARRGLCDQRVLEALAELVAEQPPAAP